MKGEHQGRAKQFLPFAALRGFEDAVAAKRRICEPRRELSETQEAQLSARLGKIKKGDLVRLTHYATDKYVTTSGEITELDTVFRFMKLGPLKVSFKDIVCIEIASNKG